MDLIREILSDARRSDRSNSAHPPPDPCQAHRTRSVNVQGTANGRRLQLIAID